MSSDQCRLVLVVWFRISHGLIIVAAAFHVGDRDIMLGREFETGNMCGHGDHLQENLVGGV